MKWPVLLVKGPCSKMCTGKWYLPVLKVNCSKGTIFRSQDFKNLYFKFNEVF